jgi:DNA-binding NtrC family response regulator
MSHKHILCVEDTPKVLESLSRVLSNYYTVTSAHNGEEALEVFEQSGPYPVALIDYSMPGMNGIELIHRIRELSPATQSILLTSHSDPDTALSAMEEAGIFKYLMKPVPMEKLLEVVAEAYQKFDK